MTGATPARPHGWGGGRGCGQHPGRDRRNPGHSEARPPGRARSRGDHSRKGGGHAPRFATRPGDRTGSPHADPRADRLGPDAPHRAGGRHRRLAAPGGHADPGADPLASSPRSWRWWPPPSS